MRELEFLPAWYPQWQSRRRTLGLQLWLTLALVGGLGLWLFLADRNCRAAEHKLSALCGQLQETGEQLDEMDKLEILRRQLRQQDEMIGKLGLHVDSAKLMSKLAALLPPTVSLLSLSYEVDETPMQLSNVAKAALKTGVPVPMDRKLKVRLLGVAPADEEMATLIMELNRVPFFENVSPTYVENMTESGHNMRKFELSFSVNLNMTSGS